MTTCRRRRRQSALLATPSSLALRIFTLSSSLIPTAHPSAHASQFLLLLLLASRQLGPQAPCRALRRLEPASGRLHNRVCCSPDLLQ